MMPHVNDDLFARMRAAASQEDRDMTAILEKLKARHVNSYRDRLIAAALGRVVRHALLNTSSERVAQGARRYPAIGFCVTGGSGAGKSKILAKCLADNPVSGVAGRHGHGSIFWWRSRRPSRLL